MDTIVDNDVITFKDIENYIYDYICQIGIRLTQELLKELDVKIMKERDTSKYRHKGLKDDHIRCIYGDVPYSRALYKTTDDEGHACFVYLLNEVLKMDTVGKMSLNVIETIAGSCTKMSYRNAAAEINRNTNINLTHQSAWNVIQKLGEKIEADEKKLVRQYQTEYMGDGEIVPVLFEEADGVFIHLQRKDRPQKQSGKEIKVSVCYKGWNESGEVVGKVMSSGFEDGKDFQRLREAAIRQVYNPDEAKLRILNGDGASWIKAVEDPETILQLDRFHIYKKIRDCIRDKEMQSRLCRMYEEKKIDELLESIQIYADSVATEDEKDRREKKALEVLGYLSENKDILLSYRDRGLEIPEPPKGICYKNPGIQENQNCTNITLRMKHNKSSWSIAGANHMAKILVRFANRTIWEDIGRYKDAIIDRDIEPVVWKILSAAKAPKTDGTGNKTGNVTTGHILYREAKMTASRKAFLSIFNERTASQLIYR